MKATLKLVSSGLAEEDLQELTHDLCNLVNAETAVSASLVTQPSVRGTRGDPITIGALALAFLTSGSAVALFQVAKTIFERKPTLEMEFEREDGKKLKIRAEQMKAGQIDQTFDMARAFFEEAT